MHASSYENMEKCYRRFISGSALEQQDIVRVLDIGGTDVNGSYRDIFRRPNYAYTAADIAAGPGVHLVLDDPYRLPLDDQSVDVVLSGQMLEHCEFFWLSFAEMVRVLRPGGYIFLIAPSGGPEHRYPVDCYRFYPDAYRALARYANCALLDCWLDPRGPWKDLVGVFQRHGYPAAAPASSEPAIVRPEDIQPGSPEEEALKGQLNYRQVLADLHEALKPASYVEIGIRHGHSLKLANGPAIGVDPEPALDTVLPDSTRIFAQTSDDFFDRSASIALTSIDFAFIDGLHLFEAALRDFMNIERYCTPNALVAVDDILPNHPRQGERARSTRAWTGDVWKLTSVLRRYRPDLTLVVLDTFPTGCLLVAGLDPHNRTLWDSYNPMVREALSNNDLPGDVLERTGTVSPVSDAYATFISSLSAGVAPVDALRALGASANMEGAA